jgi:alcohol dehydrogenase class IV
MSGAGSRFEFATAARIVFGDGAANDIGRIASEFGRRAFLVTGRDSKRAEGVAKHLHAANIGVVFFNVAGEPKIDTIRHGANSARSQQCDLVIAFGGGSAIDAGKATAAMMTNAGDVLDYLEVIGGGKPLRAAPVPFIAIPTTAGTGSEVTRNAVIGSPQHRVKASLRSPLMLAKVAIVDPELTHGLPPEVTASTGLDALTQLIEPFVCARANPLVDALCVEAIPKAARSLKAAFENGTDAGARREMAQASLFGGLALANAGLGAVHGLAAVIGGAFDAPHGAICAILLPQVMEANIRALRAREPSSSALGRYDEIARLLAGDENAGADDGVAWVEKLVGDLRIPGLSRYEVREAAITDLVEKSTKASSMKANPIVLSHEELTGIVRRAL